MACTTPITLKSPNLRSPQLKLRKQGPHTALIDSKVHFVISVSNIGDDYVEDIIVKDALPNGLRHASGEDIISYEIGNLGPGEYKTIPISLTATESGNICNTVYAISRNTAPVMTTSCVLVYNVGLDVKKYGGKVGKDNQLEYSISVSNHSDFALENVVVTDRTHPFTQIVEAPGGKIEDHRITWIIPSLAPDEKEDFTVLLKSYKSGLLCNTVTAQGPYNLFDEDKVCTDWPGVPALQLELIDTEDSLTVNESTTYIVSIINQGTGPDKNITVEMVFPEGITPLSVTGPTESKIEEGKVSFSPYQELSSGTLLEYKVQAEATKEGDNRVKVTVDSDLLTSPLEETESTIVY